LNLVLNAMDAMALTPIGRRRVSVSTNKVRDLVEIAVRDAGEGIAPEVAPRLFEPFVTTKATGMGIGLAIVQGIVTTHGGVVEARAIGVMRMRDEKGGDDKIVAVSVRDPAYADYTDKSQLPPHVIVQVRRFFEDYKVLEHKSVVVEDFLGTAEALAIIRDAF